MPDAELGGHTKHVVAPAKVLKKLLAHGNSVMAPEMAVKKPDRTGTQEVALEVATNCPAGQEIHAFEPLVLLYVPCAHSVHCDAPGRPLA